MPKRIWVRNGFVYISPDGLGPGAMDYVPAREYDELVIQHDELLGVCKDALLIIDAVALALDIAVEVGGREITGAEVRARLIAALEKAGQP